MRKTDLTEFSDFMLDEAGRYGRTLTKPEIETYFENFGRVTIADFKSAWHEHKRDDKDGKFFPKIVDLQRRLRTTGQDQAKRDWRCSEEVGNQHCNYPGGIIAVGQRALCAAHYRLKGSDAYTSDKSLQIIEESQSYVPPKTVMELMERGSALRETSGERWRKVNGVGATKRLAADATPALPPQLSKPEDEPLPAPTDLDAVNELAAHAGVQ
jgi:hypothetical protein